MSTEVRDRFLEAQKRAEKHDKAVRAYIRQRRRELRKNRKVRSHRAR